MMRYGECLEAAGKAAVARDWAVAARLYGQALQSSDRDPAIWVQLGHMLKEADLLPEAAEAYAAAIARDQADPDARLHLAHLLKRLGRMDEALAAFRALAALPRAPHVQPEIMALTLDAVDPFRLQRFRAHVPPADAASAAMRSDFAALAPRLTPPRRAAGGWRHLERLPLLGALLRLGGRFVRLKPVQHVERDGDSFRASGPMPRLRLVLPFGLGAFGGGWLRLSFDLAAEGPPVDPLLLLEHAPFAAAITAGYVRRDGKGRYETVVHAPAPLVSARLEPMRRPGPFAIRDLRLERLSLLALWRLVRAREPAAARTILADALRKASPAAARNALGARLTIPAPTPYDRWIDGCEALPAPPADLSGAPVSLALLATAATPAEALAATVASVLDQTVPPAELLLVSDGSAPPLPPALADRAAGRMRRIAVEDASRSGAALQAALDAATGIWFGRLHPGDRLPPAALGAWATALTGPAPDIVYADEDRLDPAGRRIDPAFKPDWNRLYLRGFDYIGAACLLRREAALAAGGYRQRDDGHEDYDLRLRMTLSDGAQVRHLPHVLLHRAELPPPRSTVAVVAEALATVEPALTVEEGPRLGTTRLRRPLPVPPPKVTVIIPTRDRDDLLRVCLGSLFARTDYPDYEVIVVDNGSSAPATLAYLAELDARAGCRVLRAPGPFNYSRLNNLAAAGARGAVLALLNDDMEILQGDWLAELVSHAVRPEVGAVGGKLLYRSGHVQHAGVLVGVAAVAANGHKYADGDAPGYMNRLIVAHQVTAVLGACLIVERRKYLEVGGLDEEHLKVAFNEVDFCLKLEAAGYPSVFTPHARLYHYESVSRGLDLSSAAAARFATEADVMRKRWGRRVEVDPCYSPNLTRHFEDFSIAEPG